jgi:hypothetical protein
VKRKPLNEDPAVEEPVGRLGIGVIAPRLDDEASAANFNGALRDRPLSLIRMIKASKEVLRLVLGHDNVVEGNAQLLVQRKHHLLCLRDAASVRGGDDDPSATQPTKFSRHGSLDGDHRIAHQRPLRRDTRGVRHHTGVALRGERHWGEGEPTVDIWRWEGDAAVDTGSWKDEPRAYGLLGTLGAMAGEMPNPPASKAASGVPALGKLVVRGEAPEAPAAERLFIGWWTRPRTLSGDRPAGSA